MPTVREYGKDYLFAPPFPRPLFLGLLPSTDCPPPGSGGGGLTKSSPPPAMDSRLLRKRARRSPERRGGGGKATEGQGSRRTAEEAPEGANGGTRLREDDPHGGVLGGEVRGEEGKRVAEEGAQAREPAKACQLRRPQQQKLERARAERKLCAQA